jgi:hypothetical protein
MLDYRLRLDMNLLTMSIEFCAPQVDGNTCSVVVGATAILLDGNSADVQKDAYELIEAVLNNTDLLGSFAPSIVRAQYVKPVGNTLVFSPENDPAPTTPSSVTATIAVAAASVSFLVASIFCYGLLRRDMRNHPEPSIRHKNRLRKGRQIVGNPMGIRSRQRSFVRLEDFAMSPAGHTSIVTTSFATSQHEYTPSITWSISDITSDSASLKSNLSRRTSNLERIEEEEEESDDEYESVGEEYDDQSSDFYHRSAPVAQLYALSPIKYTAKNFFQEPRPDFAELHGCRFVEDDDGRHVTGPVIRDVDDDLQVSLDDDYEAEIEEPLPSLLDGELAWNVRSPKIGTDEDSLHLESLKEMDASVASVSIRNGTKEGFSGRIKQSEKVIPVTNAPPFDAINVVSPASTAPKDDVEDPDQDEQVFPSNLAPPFDAINVVSPASTAPKDDVEDPDQDEQIFPSNLADDLEASVYPSILEGDANDEAMNGKAAIADSVAQGIQQVSEESNPSETVELATEPPYDTDDERPWIGIANGYAIVVIDDDYDYQSECPTTPRSDCSYETEYFETPRQYEDATDRSFCDEI